VMDGVPERFCDRCLDSWRSGGTAQSDQKGCREMECRRQRRRGGTGGRDGMKSDGQHGRDCISPKEGGESSVLMWVKRKASNQRAGQMGVDDDARSHWPTRTPWVLCDPHFTALCAPGCSAALLGPWATVFWRGIEKIQHTTAILTEVANVEKDAARPWRRDDGVGDTSWLALCTGLRRLVRTSPRAPTSFHYHSVGSRPYYSERAPNVEN
jgi:hypothetical protein